jgi:hypothetical protein
MFENAEVQVMARRSSDHHPILLNFNNAKNYAWRKKKKKKKKPFRMEPSWTKRNDFIDTVQATLSERGGRRDPWGKIKGKLEKCQKNYQSVGKKDCTCHGKTHSGEIPKISEYSNGQWGFGQGG